MSKININGLPKEKVLAALYNASKQQGVGFLQAAGAKTITEAEAAEEIQHVKDNYARINAEVAERNPDAKPQPVRLYFDYLRGRVMKVDITGDELDPWGFDRDNGEGAAERALRALLE
jgi:hypothetical protein